MNINEIHGSVIGLLDIISNINHMHIVSPHSAHAHISQ